MLYSNGIHVRGIKRMLLANRRFPSQVKVAGPNAQSNRLLSALQKLDYKFLLVPVAFIMLRIWSFLGDVVFVFFGVRQIKPHYLAKALMYLEVCVLETL